MGIESFEKDKLENVNAESLSQSLEIKPLTPVENKETKESLEIGKENVETKSDAFLLFEKFQRMRFEKQEVLHDSEMTEHIAEYLSGMESLKYENWQKLSLEERKNLLNTIERQIAAIEHRPPLPIMVESMKASVFGYQSSYYNKIALNSLYVASNKLDDYNDVIETIIHEGRHAYQHYNVDKKLIHESASVVNTWKENYYNPKYRYYSGEKFIIPVKGVLQDVGYRLYYYQPVEIDARNFAADVMLNLKKKVFFK